MATSTFNFKKFVVDTVRMALIDIPVGMVRAVGYDVKNTLHATGKKALQDIRSIPDTLVDKVRNLDETLGNIPVAPGLTVEQMLVALSNPAENKDDFTIAVEAFTGVNINSLTPTTPTDRQIEARLQEFAIALRQQILFEVQECISRYLRGIVSKNLDIFKLINFENYLANQIAKFRIALRNKIQSQIEKLFLNKLRIQQVALLKQKILQAIRSICPSSGALSPTLTRRLQEDRTWEVAEHNKSIVETGAESNLELLANSQKDGNTGQGVIDVADKSIELVTPIAKKQAAGYNDNTVDDFISSTGELVPV